MNKVETVNTIKQVGTIIVSAGVGAIVANAVRYTTPSGINTIKRVCIGVGSFMLGGMLSDKVSDYAREMVDTFVEGVELGMKHLNEETSEEVKPEVSE